MKTKEVSGKRIKYSSRTQHSDQYLKETGKGTLYNSLYTPLYKRMYS